MPANTASNAEITAQEPTQAEPTPSFPDADGKKSIANLLLFLNPKLQCTLSRQQQALLLRATVIASALPSTTATMSLIARQVETKTKIPLLPSELSTQRFTHMLLSVYLMA